MFNKKRKLCVVITARASYSRCKSLLRAIKNSHEFTLDIVLTASALLDKYGKIGDQIQRDGFTVYARAHSLIETDGDPCSMGLTTGTGIIQLTQIFNKMQPSAVITIADRYETIATAISATYSGIPLIHIQGGEITGNIDERVRHAITKLSDIHFPSCEYAKKAILNMGEDPRFVFNEGCPSIDLISETNSVAVDTLQREIEARGVGAPVCVSKPYWVVLLHPVTNEIQLAETQAKNLLEALDRTEMQCVWFWPNADAGTANTSRAIRTFREEKPENSFRFIKNLPPEIFIALLKQSVGLAGNSSAGIRECAYLGVRAVNIGSRQHGRERGPNVIDTSGETEDVYKALMRIAKLGDKCEPSYIYGSGNAGKKICARLETLDFINPKNFNFVN